MFDNQVATLDVNGRAAHIRIETVDHRGLRESYEQTLAPSPV
jgi:hypothetical protein